MSPEVKKIFKEKGIQQIIKEKNRLDFGYDFIPYVIQTGRPVYGYTLKGSWFDVGTPKSYLEAMKNLLNGGFSTLNDFGGRLNEESLVWVQGESNDSEKRRQEIIQSLSAPTHPRRIPKPNNNSKLSISIKAFTKVIEFPKSPKGAQTMVTLEAVSYTHLTLP